jgi:hypothetical protein
MGTNYYAIPQATDEDLESYIKLVKERNFNELIKIIPQKFHIGKSSFGWKFLFNHNNWQYFNKNLKSMKSVLRKSIITDEYGYEVSSEDFWKIVKSQEGGMDNKQYYENLDRTTANRLYSNMMKDTNYGQEYHFGLFFSDCTNFS